VSANRKIDDDPIGVQVLHWADAEGFWERISWRDWKQFRSKKIAEVSDKVAAAVQEKFFALVIHRDGEVVNVIPHKYRLHNDGKVHPVDGFTDDECAEFWRLMLKEEMNIGEQQRLDELRRLLWSSNLPAAQAGAALFRQIGVRVTRNPGASCWSFFNACGIPTPPRIGSSN
jgi:hypothetical protein